MVKQSLSDGMPEDFYSIDPVSYTHLDVYKRQEERVFHNLSTTYQQIVDNVGKDIHGTHRGFYPQFFPGFPQKIP